MKALLQRVTTASVRVDGVPVGAIGRGTLALIGVEPADTVAQAERLAQRILSYRMFPDEQGRMNRSLTESGGGLLLVSQFTLVADTRKGNRPGFSTAASPAVAEPLFDRLVACCRTGLDRVETGQFGADMQVELVNDGPVTFWLSA